MLASAFGVEHDVYGIGTVRNQSIFCLDTSRGKVLWSKDGILLNEGKALATERGFLVLDDSGRFHLLDADTGKSLGDIPPLRELTSFYLFRGPTVYS